MHSENKLSRSESVLLSLFDNISDDIQLFIDQKNFVMDVHEKMPPKQVIDVTRSLLKDREILPEIYTELIFNDPDKAIRLMGQYLSLGVRLGTLNMDPIKMFIESNREIACKKFSDNMDIFISKVLPVIFDNNLFQDLENIGLVLSEHDVELPVLMDELVSIQIKNCPTITQFIDCDFNTGLIDTYFSKSKITPPPVMRGMKQSLNYYKDVLSNI